MLTLALVALAGLSAPARHSLTLAEMWRVQPADRPETPPNEAQWGTMPARDWRSTRPEAKGTNWRPEARATVHSLWYEQSFDVPADWRGQRVVADFRRIEGDGIVFLNGTRVGELLRPGGEVDLTAQVAPEQRNVLRLFLTRDYTGISRGFEQDPLRYATRHGKYPIDRWPFGITAPVTIATRPRPAAITDLFVMPSWRRRELTIEVEVEADLPLPEVQLAGRARDSDGHEALVLQPVEVELPAGRSTHRLIVPWANPRPWELEAPYLYTAELELRRAGGLADAAPPQRFGFREIWTEGRQLLLNGHPVRWRLTWANSGLTPVSLSFYRLLGFNVFQFQPNPTAWWSVWPETPIYDEATLTALDEAGCGATLPVPGISNLKPGVLNDPRMQADYDREMRLHVRRYRHHPSILAYAVGMNSYCPPANIHAQGMGRRPTEDRNGNALAIEHGCRVVRSYDPTRLAFSHADGSTGELSTSNVYLNFVPLQEREEWPMAWAESGNMPYSAVEFGEPYTANFWKGKQFLLTEYLAIYLGDRAYALECEAGQRRIVEYGLANTGGHGAFGKVDLADWPGYWDFQRLFVRATDRAWRTWGVNGGWQYWNFALGYGDPPGYNGNVFSRYSALAEPVSARPAWANANFDIYRENNQPLLAWLAGAPRFTDKTHSFYTGEQIRKQIALVWDGPGRRELVTRWWLFSGEQTLGQGESVVALEPGDIRLVPLEVVAPQVPEPTHGRLELAVLERGQVVARDRQAIEVHPRPAATRPAGRIAVWDPAGRSAPWLRSLGFEPAAWAPGQSLDGLDLLVVGREALEPGRPLPWDAAAIERGGRVLVLEQRPEIWEGLGFRNADTAPRQVFARDSGSGLLQGVGPEALAYWRGSPDLLTEGRAAREFDVQHAPKWTNSHAVASTVMEIPHVVGLTPLLACEFDQAYSPLLTWRHGQGQVTFCSLDLSGRVGSDPDATRLARNLVAECLQPPPARQVVRYLGGPRGRALLGRLGVATNEEAAGLLVIGEGTIDQTAVTAAIGAGARAVYLPQTAEALAARGYRVRAQTLWRAAGSEHPLLRAVGPSLLRWRDALEAVVFEPEGQPAGCEVLAGGLLLVHRRGRGSEVFLQAEPGLLADRYPAGDGRHEATKLSVVRLEQMVAQVLTNAGAGLSAGRAERLCSLQAGPGYDDLRDWRVLGPFAQPKDDGPGLIGAVIAQEQEALAGRTDTALWRPARASDDGFVNLGAALGADQSVVGYAVAVIREEEARTARLRLGVDYWLAAYLNGEPIYRVTTGHGSPRPSRHLVDVPLQAGANVLCLKIGSGGKGFGFWASISRPGWDPALPAGREPAGQELYDRDIGLADPYEFRYW